MSRKKRRKKKFVDIWGEGEYFDLWSLVHFLGGVLLGFLIFLTNLSLVIIFGLALVLIILWEAFEYVKKIKETRGNRVVDVLVAVIGFGLTIVVYPATPPDFTAASAVILLLIFLALNISGWLSWLRQG